MKQILKYIYDFEINTYWGTPNTFDKRYYHLLLEDICNWLREGKDIYVRVDSVNYTNHYCWIYYNNFKNYIHTVGKDNYIDAFEEGVLEALKLIK